MKKMIVMLAVAFSTIAYAKEAGSVLTDKVKGADVIDGCGLGWQVTQSRTMLGTTTRGTINMTVPASFGMTSGTLGCEKINFAAKDEKAATFVSANFMNLKSEIAEGKGEYLTGALEVFGCSNVNEMSLRLQKNYSKVVSPSADAQELFYNMKKEINNCI